MIKKFNVEKTKKISLLNKYLSFVYKKPNSKFYGEFEDVKNILIVDFSLIGDMIMNIPFLKTLKKNCPNSKITMVAMPWADSILGDQNLVDDIIIFDGKNKLSSPKAILRNWHSIKQTLKKINKKTYQYAFEPKGDLRHIWFMHMTNSLNTVTYSYTGGEYLVTDCFTPLEATSHLVDEKLDLLALIGMKIFDENKVPKLVLKEEDVESLGLFKSENDLVGKYIIGLHPGASNLNKQYQQYPQLIEIIKDKLEKDTVFLVFEGPGESEIVDKVCEKIKNNSINYLRVKKSINEYVKLVSLCDVMICNDSAAGHIAAAYGIPAVVVFGPVEPKVAVPRGDCSIIPISHMLDCKPCTLPMCPYKTNACIEGIKPDEIAEAFNKVVNYN